MLPAITNAPAHSEFGDAIFAFDNPSIAATLHIRSSLNLSATLPIISFCDPSLSETLNWDLFSGRRIHLVTSQITSRVLDAARNCDGRVISCKSAFERNFFLTESPENCLRWIAKQSRYWQDALIEEIGQLGFDASIDFIKQLALPRSKLALLAESPNNPVARDRFRAVLSGESPHATLLVESTQPPTTIQSTHNGWSIRNRYGKTHRRTNFAFTVDRHIQGTTSGTRYFRATLRLNGRFINVAGPWRSPMANLQFLSQTAARHARGVKLNFAEFRIGDQTVFDLGERFGRPSTVSQPDRAGWNSSIGGFVFADYIVNAEGSPTAFEESWATIDPEFPAAFGPYAEPTPPEIAALGENTPETRIYWRLLVAATAAIVAPAVAIPTPAYAVLDDIASSLQEFGAAFQLSTQSNSQHNWPRLIADAGDNASAAGNLFTNVTRRQSYQLVRTPTWQVIWSEEARRGVIPAITSPLPSFLQYLCARQLSLPGSSRMSLEPRIALGYQFWFARLGGRTQVIADANATGCSWTLASP